METVEPHGGLGVRGRRELVGQTDVSRQLPGLRDAGEERVGSFVDRRQAAEGGGAELAAESIVGLPDDDLDVLWVGLAGQVHGGGQPRDPASDDDDAPPPVTAMSDVRRHATHRSSRSRIRPARAAITVGSSFIDAVRSNVNPWALRPLTRLDVEVVQHLEVIGNEPARAHEQPIGVLGRRELVDHAQDVGTEPRFWRASG